ncbi:Na+/H+ antiporter NhaC family protein [Pseudalkalibacillus hwajinpoensis]|uniref:Na+/H+ antiporter NhaC family protein n=1 Tax=Guptibacillus hwajinpoensis TaxID=208199 RepID=A0A4V5Q1D0_9BACL|nr:Na+/H+ antiporter NhaC family protein [Pseudalkalibacillus hwajinpoensis]TKD69308.1 Na+/H+ antiporter NhaC family protein [Pseudalkalibacillus hwajinpoensis]
MENSFLSIIPPLVALLMVVVTRKVLPSLGVGIILGALMINNWSVTASIKEIYTIVKGIIVDTESGGLNTWNMYIIFFLLLLGMMTAFISISGGSRAFGEWAMKRVKTRVGAQVVTAIFGVIIFIDDYFNSLAVGNVSRPITDRHKVSRAKLAYIIDSTAAPMCIISPISSWGAYIIALIGGVLATHSITGVGALEAFMRMVPMNLYALFALAMVFFVSYFDINLKAMKVHEDRAQTSGEVLDPEKGAVPGETTGLPESDKGSVADLAWPIIMLIAGTVTFMIVTGIQAVSGTDTAVTVLSIFENTDVATSLLYGGLIGLATSLIFFFMKRMGGAVLGKGIWEGIKSMLPAVYILFFAWTLIEIIGSLGTGQYLAGLVNEHIVIGFLPAILFLLAGVMAFATGTSWGTFGIMLPIAGEIAAATDPTFMLPVLAAVLAGAVFGDHCSPISDTTILSSTGAGSHHIDHVMTQLPYALLVAGISLLGYLVLGFTGSSILGLVATAILFGILVFMLKTKYANRPVEVAKN